MTTKQIQPTVDELEATLKKLQNIASYDVWHKAENLEERIFWWFKEHAVTLNNTLTQALEIAKGDKCVVPREPTQEMINKCLGKDETEENKMFVEGCYICMIAVAEGE